MAEIFAVHVSPLELVVRGTLVYWFLFLVLRFILRRDVGAVGIADILFLVIVADASQNAMGGGYDTVSEGAILVGTLIGWNWLLDYLSFRYAWARKLAEPSRLQLVRNGVPLRRNRRREFVTMQELREKLREQGLDNLADVRAAYLEGDGQISVLRHSPESDSKPRERTAGAG